MIGEREEKVLTGATPAIGDCDFEWIFTDSNAIGTTLPDFVATFNTGQPWPYNEWYRTLTFFGSATGPLHSASGFPEGAQGTLNIAQVAHCNDTDQWPVEIVDVALAETTYPIEDFVNAQGHTSIWNPYGDECAWSESPSEVAQPKAGWFDWLGFAEKYYSDHGATTHNTVITGSVKQVSMTHGRLVHVVLHTENAIAWAISDFAADTNSWRAFPTLIGAREDSVLLGATPAIGDCDFEWIFSDSNAVGSTLPDFVATFNAGYPWPYNDWYQTLSFYGTATGLLHAASGYPEGAQGTLYIAQLAYSGEADQWPVEVVSVTMAP
jgi:hypothetical protein